MTETVNIRELNDLIASKSNFVSMIRTGMDRRIVGQKHLVDSLLIALLCNGHILLEGVPGLAKTLAIKTLASLVDAKYNRIQFTPDLLPADVIGTLIYSVKKRDFRGPQRSCLRQFRACRRDKPCPCKGAERTPRGNAGTPGNNR